MNILLNNNIKLYKYLLYHNIILLNYNVIIIHIEYYFVEHNNHFYSV